MVIKNTLEIICIGNSNSNECIIPFEYHNYCKYLKSSLCTNSFQKPSEILLYHKKWIPENSNSVEYFNEKSEITLLKNDCLN